MVDGVLSAMILINEPGNSFDSVESVVHFNDTNHRLGRAFLGQGPHASVDGCNAFRRAIMFILCISVFCETGGCD